MDAWKKVVKWVISLTEDTFWNNVTIFINMSKDEVDKHIAKTCWDDAPKVPIEEDENWLSFTLENKSLQRRLPIIFIRNYNNDKEWDAVFVHEISHFLFTILDWRWIDVKWSDVSTQEVFCYMIDFYYKQWRDKIDKIYERANRNRPVTKGVNNVASELKDKNDKAHSSHKWKSVKKNKVKIWPKGVKKNNWRNKVKNK